MVIVSVHGSSGCKVSLKVGILTTSVMRALAGFGPIALNLLLKISYHILDAGWPCFVVRTLLRWEVVYVFLLRKLLGQPLLQSG